MFLQKIDFRIGFLKSLNFFFVFAYVFAFIWDPNPRHLFLGGSDDLCATPPGRL
jgi:hypothetical protein